VRVRIYPQAASFKAGQKVPAGATVVISDNGPGIPDDVKPHLFQPFFTTKGEHGTGLGLWVSRGIVNKHGGTIALTSDTTNSKHGATVSVFLATKPIIHAGGD
jgi:signal transduction histidine kinase